MKRITEGEPFLLPMRTSTLRACCIFLLLLVHDVDSAKGKKKANKKQVTYQNTSWYMTKGFTETVLVQLKRTSGKLKRNCIGIQNRGQCRLHVWKYRTNMHLSVKRRLNKSTHDIFWEKWPTVPLSMIVAFFSALFTQPCQTGYFG